MESTQSNAYRWLSQDLTDLIQKQSKRPKAYDLVIVGSGYGGSMAAAELAGLVNQDGKPLKICLLERGKEYLPGSFPSQIGELPGHVRVTTANARKPQGFSDGLFDVRIGPDVCALVANGLGGGSLINAGVMEIPKWRERDSHRLPPQVLAYLGSANYESIKEKLGALKNTIAAHPEIVKNGTLQKTSSLEKLDPVNFAEPKPSPKEKETLTTFRLADISVEMSKTPSANLRTCTLCGDCMTGCNVGAKKSLDTNLLHCAHQKNLEIYTGASVLKLDRQGKYWQLYVVHADENNRKHQAKPLQLLASKVILAAGTLGSTEILLRSKSEALQFSSRLGQQFSCNGDNIATFYKLRDKVNAVADENTPITAGSRRIGPTITAMLDIPATQTRQGFLLQEFAIPGAMARMFREVLTTANTLYELPRGDRKTHKAARNDEELDPCAVDPDAIENSLLIGIIGHDSSSGVLNLPQEKDLKKMHDGMIQIAWPDARHGAAISDAMDYLGQLGNKTLLQADGRLIPNPLWQIGPKSMSDLINQPRGPVLTVHPLGGCPMGTSVENGVVNHYGMVFDAKVNNRKQWQGSLFVLDGAILPSSLGANPALTIATLAHRACGKLRELWQQEHQWYLPAEAALVKPIKPLGARPIFRTPDDCISPAQPTTLKMSERLVGNMLLHRDDGVMHGFFVELTLRYETVQLEQLMSTLKRHVTLIEGKNGAIGALATGSRIRIFDEKEWQTLKFASDYEREKKALFKANLTGTLAIFDREPSYAFTRTLRALAAWFPNRGLRDLTQMAIENWRKPGSKFKKLSQLPMTSIEKGMDFLNIASHAGGVRRLDYKLTIGEGSALDHSPIFRLTSPQGSKLVGEKRLTYARRANPLRQLSDLHVTKFPRMARGVYSKISLDLSFVALQEIPLAQIVGQKNQITALAEIASFGLYILRLMLITHLWTFRKPDSSPLRKPERLPKALPDLPEPEITEIDLRPAVRGIPVRVRLTRFHRQNVCESCPNDVKPLLMIHGYSASGTTFAHPAIGTSMAQFFVEQCRDVWIVDLRTSAGMPSATLPWHFEEVALADIPVAVAHILRVTGADKVDIFAHCIGATMLSMAILTKPENIHEIFPRELVDWQRPPQRYYQQELTLMQKSIRRIVLSQKGPVLVYTPDNMLRAWLMRTLRKLILPDDFQFHIDEDPSLQDQLMDRWLNVLPYPEEEFDTENPFLWYRPCEWGKRTPWVGFRHRMDALYARDFSVNNIDETTLASIEDLFGPLNLEIVSQAIHFVRFNKITDAFGRNIFVNRHNLQQRWSKIEETMSIHGTENGLVDKETLNRMDSLMADAGIRFTKQAFEGFGHQDMLIGRNNKKVFEEIENFLRRPAKDLPSSYTPTLVCDLPWLGPRFEADPAGKGNNLVAVMPDPKLGSALVLCIPVLKTSTQNKNGEKSIHFCLPENFDTSITPTLAHNAVWTSFDVPEVLLKLAPNTEILVVMLYEEAGAVGQSIPSITELPPIPANKMQEILQKLSEQSPTADIVEAVFSVDNILTPIGQETTEPFVFAFGSCQYPVGLMDRPVAQASITRLAQRFEPAPASAKEQIRQQIRQQLRPQLLLLLGDQIYSDATAGVLDPTRADARYLHPHEDWLRMPPLRKVMRNIPVYCMLDDHEIIDNWSPNAASKTNWHITQGRKYYLDFQPRAKQQTLLQQQANELWYTFEHAGLPFFMADSRTEREERTADNADKTIISERQMQALCDWLSACPVDKPKIIASASMLLPRHVATESDILQLDGWDGFPASLQRLLAYICDQQIAKVIFLSGDEHLSSVTKISLSNAENGTQAQVLSLHSSGFYAPFPFANAVPASLLQNDSFSFPETAATYQCSTTTTLINQGDGYMLVKLWLDNGEWHLHLEFDGNAKQAWALPDSPWIL